MTDQDLLSILGENAQSKNLTAKKTNEIMQRDKSVITGFVVTDIPWPKLLSEILNEAGIGITIDEETRKRNFEDGIRHIQG